MRANVHSTAESEARSTPNWVAKLVVNDETKMIDL